MERVGLDSLPPVTEDEALELCIHHLSLACIYWQNCPDDHAACLRELLISTVRRDTRLNESPDYIAGAAFMTALHEKFEGYKQEQGG